MYPIAINHIARILLVNETAGWMAACGAGGSALPFMTVTMASNLGTESMTFLPIPTAPIHKFF
jgi:hypothetical protein